MDSSGRSSICGKMTVLPGNRPSLTAARPSRKASRPPMAARLALVDSASRLDQFQRVAQVGDAGPRRADDALVLRQDRAQVQLGRRAFRQPGEDVVNAVLGQRGHGVRDDAGHRDHRDDVVERAVRAGSSPVCGLTRISSMPRSSISLPKRVRMRPRRSSLTSLTTMVFGGLGSMTARWMCIWPIGPPAPTNQTLPPGMMSWRVLLV